MFGTGISNSFPAVLSLLDSFHTSLAQSPIDSLPENLEKYAEIGLAVLIMVLGIIVGYTARKLLLKVFESAGVDEFTEGTTFERAAESFGTSTVGIIASTAAWVIYLSSVIIALDTVGINLFSDNVFVVSVTNYIPSVIAAFFLLVFGVIIGDKASILISEKLEGIKVTDVSIVPLSVKYSIIFIAIIMSLSQLGISTTALYILLAAYLFGIILVAVFALKNIISNMVSGLYILLTQPYQIGDTIKVGEIEGIVQEVDMFTTRVEDEEHEHVVPNYEILEEGVSREVK